MREVEVDVPLKGIVARSKELLVTASSEALTGGSQVKSPESDAVPESSEQLHTRQFSNRASDANLGYRQSYASSHAAAAAVEDADLQLLQAALAKLTANTNTLLENANNTIKSVSVAASGLNHANLRRGNVSPEAWKETLATLTSAVQASADETASLVEKFNDLSCARENAIQQIGIDDFDTNAEETVSDDAVKPLKSLGKVLENHRSDSTYSISTFADDNASAASSAPASPSKAKSMFPRLPAEIAESGLSKAECMRLSVVYELIDTEMDYVRDLSLMVTYHKPEIVKTGLCTEEDVDALFSNADELIKVNQQLLDRLVEKKAADPLMPEVCDALVDVADSFKIYTTYCANYPEAMKLVHKLQAQPEFKTHLERLMSSTEGRGLSVESFLIKPVQRICKYPLLLRELQKFTNKNSKDTIPLQLAFDKIESVVSMVNEATRQMGDRDRVASLETKIESQYPVQFDMKRFVKDGNVIRILNGRSKDRYIILFSDILYICKSVGKNGKYPLETVYDTSELTMKTEKPDPSKPATRNVVQLYLSNFKDMLVFSFPTEEERNKWNDAFNNAIEIGTKDTHKRSVSDIKRSSIALHRQSSDVGGDDSGGISGGLRALNRSLTTRRKKQNSADPNISQNGTMKWKTLSKRKSEFESSSALAAVFGNEDLGSVEQIRDDPELVEIEGNIWKRALSAMGTCYYYNPVSKESAWALPDKYTVLDPETGLKIGGTEVEETKAEESADNAADFEGSAVEGKPDLRKMTDANGSTYYYNVKTMESFWEIPA